MDEPQRQRTPQARTGAVRARILVCEDYELMRRLIVDVLEGTDHVAIPTASVAEALAQLAATRVDLLVLDLNLRGESGRRVIEHMRASPAHVRTPIVLLSGEFEGPDDHYAVGYGADATLPKPFDPELFIETVDALLVRPPGS